MNQVVEKHRQILLDKFKNKDLVLDEDDKCILELYPEYTKIIIEILSSSVEYWNNDIYSLINDEYFITMDSELIDDFWLNYTKFLYNNKLTIDEDMIESVYDYLNLKKETKEQINYMLAKQQQEISENTTHITIEQLTELYENKRFDLIAKIDYELYNVPDDLMANIMTDFPYEQYESPIFFAKYKHIFSKTINDFNKLSLKTLVKMAEKAKSSSSYLYSYDIQEIIKHIKYKFQNLKFTKPTLLPINLESIMIELSPDKQELSKFVFENNNLTLLPFALECNEGTKEQQKEFIIEYINEKKDIDGLLKSSLNIQNLKNHQEIIDCLIENGCIHFLLENNLIEPNSIEEQRIINNITSSHPNYQKINNYICLTENIIKYPNIIETIVDNCKIKEIRLETSDDNFFSIYKYTDEIHNALIRLLSKHKNIQISKISTIESSHHLNELTNVLFANEMYNQIINIINGIYNKRELIEKYIKDNIEIFSKIFKNSLSFPKKLIESSHNIVLENKSLIKVCCENSYSAQLLINQINHNEAYAHLYTHELFLDLVDVFAEQYKISKERLLKIEEVLGPKIIRYIENENIQELLKWNDEDFKKVIALFPKVEFTMRDLEASYDSLKQYEFSKKYPNEVSVFPNILHAIEDNNDQALKEYVEKIHSYLDKTLFKNLSNKYVLPLEYNQDNPKLFLIFIIAKIKESESSKKEKYIDILHMITDYYILKKREEYRKTYDMIGELELTYTYESKSFDNEYFKALISNRDSAVIEYTIDNLGNRKDEQITLNEYLYRKMSYYGLNESQIEDTIRFYANPSLFNETLSQETKNIDEIKKNFKYVVKAMKEISTEQPLHSIFNDLSKKYYLSSMNLDKVKKIYTPGENALDIFDILTTLKLDVLKNRVLANEEVYSSLVNLMSKRKLHLLPASIKKILNTENINVSDDLTNISAFISYYAQIYEKEKSTLASNNKKTADFAINLINILINAEVYSGTSSVYSQVLGDVDSKLIKSNPGPNSASYKLANNARLKEAVELTIQNFQRQSVTVPTFNEVVNIENDKQMRIIVGNFTHPTNLTHGERTGACMRIGGVGESLFYFCLKNPNGFHIRFEDPKTNEYISRVSGFRNGNTVFLNELRYSCNPELYSNDDVIEACKKAAEYLIELSKDSNSPIENVVIHRAYAMISMPKEPITLDKKNIKEGLPPFYSDVSNNAIVLATTAKNSAFVPLDFKKNQVPEYLPAREKPLLYEDVQKAGPKIIRIETIKRILAGENYEYIEPYEFKEELKYAVVSEDWYIYIDEKGNIHHNIIDIDPRAKEELTEYLIKFETEFKNDVSKENTYGNK